MKNVKVLCAEAFSAQPQKGNPAGVVFDADDLSDGEMQQLAKIVGFNETVFILKSALADVRLRYFTPNHEMNLCGHGTVAAICELMKREHAGESKRLSLETLAGIIDVCYDKNLHEVTMGQRKAEFKTFGGNVEALAASIGLGKDDIDEKYSVVYGSTGTWTVLVPIRHIEAFTRMIPENKKFAEILTELPTASVHPFSLETFGPDSDMHGRHFSASHSGTVEDPVTGTASGVMGAYYVAYIKKMDTASLLVEQGQEIGRDGHVRVLVSKGEDGIDVSISGTSIFTKEMVLTI